MVCPELSSLELILLPCGCNPKRSPQTKHLTLEATLECILTNRSSKSMPHALQIGDVAQETGLTVDAIRFYEKESLLPRPARSAGGFRLYTGESVERLHFIQQAQTLGFSLAEIRELLLLRDEKLKACSHVRDLLRSKLESVRQKIDQLQTLESDLKAALRSCNRSLKAHTSAEEECCPVLEQIAHADRQEGKS